MLTSAAPAGPSQGAAGVLAALLEARTGQQLAQDRAWRIDTALKPLLRQRGFDDLDALVRELLGGDDPILADRIVDALVNQETSFFRDAAMFEQVADALAGIAKGRRVRIWSAACATGQEPLSLAMLLTERGIDFEMLATDVSDGALARARQGRYTQFEIQRGLPIRRMLRWFDAADAEWQAKPELMRRLQFRRLNLVGDPCPAGRYDLVLCRNVLLYLAPQQRSAVFDQLAAALRPGGSLVLGAGETVSGQTDAFIPSPRHRGLYEVSKGASARAVA